MRLRARRGRDGGETMVRKILVLADDVAAGLQYERLLLPQGFAVQFCAAPRDGGPVALNGGCDTILLSPSASEAAGRELLRQLKASGVPQPVIVLSRHPSVAAAVAAMRDGAADYLPAACSAEELAAALQRVGPPTTLPRSEERSGAAEEPEGFEGLLGQCPSMHEVFALIERIAPADVTVLVSGESGTGKELVARAIHRRSRRAQNPLLACDCTALAPTLLESELFGHVKGSFSGAIATKQGLFEVADQGTLFLDEVSNLSMETQGKLLRVLETRHVRKVGATAEHEVNIRLIATTNRDLAEMVKVGAFRADLYYRLNVVPVLLPPLRQRAGDVPLLALTFLRRFSERMGLEVKGFSSEALRQLEVYAWPGNVRELRNIVERLAVLYGGTRIEFSHLPVEIREAKALVSAAEVPPTWEELKRLKHAVVEDLERRFLTAALDRCAQNVTAAAENVGMQRTNFHALLRQHGLRTEKSRER